MSHDEIDVCADGLSDIRIALMRQEQYVYDAECLLDQRAEKRAANHFEVPLPGVHSTVVDSVHIKWILKSHCSEEAQPEPLRIPLPCLVAAASTLIILGGGLPRLCLNLAGNSVVNRAGCTTLNSDLAACSSVMPLATVSITHHVMQQTLCTAAVRLADSPCE